MQTFNIIKTIDFDLFDKKIEEYKRENEQTPYMFMNTETIKQVFKSTFVDSYLAIRREYGGCVVFCNNDLQYGEVELR